MSRECLIPPTADAAQQLLDVHKPLMQFYSMDSLRFMLDDVRIGNKRAFRGGGTDGLCGSTCAVASGRRNVARLHHDDA